MRNRILLLLCAALLLLSVCGCAAKPEEEVFLEIAGKSCSSFTETLNLESLELTEADLSNIGKLHALKSLTISAIVLENLDFMKSLKALETLSLSSCQVRDFSALAELGALKTLELTHTVYPGAEATLCSVTQLEDLAFSSTGACDLSFLSSFTNLKKLSLFGPVSDLTPLSGLHALETLYITQSQVSDLTPIGSLTNLRTLLIVQANIRDASPLSGCTSLETVSLQLNQITDASPLASLPALQSADLQSNPVDLSTIQGIALVSVSDDAGQEVHYRYGTVVTPDSGSN